MTQQQQFYQQRKAVNNKSANIFCLCVTCNRAFCVLSAFNGERDYFQLYVDNCGIFEKRDKRPGKIIHI